jgi:hypothetical protein
MRATTRVFFGGHTPILAMYGADRHVEPDRLRQLANAPEMREATTEELTQLKSHRVTGDRTCVNYSANR